MTNRLMISVAAAALIAGTGFANAQGTGTGREGAVSRSPRHSAIGGTGDEPITDSEASDARHEARSPRRRCSRRAAEGQRAQDDMKATRGPNRPRNRAEDMQ